MHFYNRTFNTDFKEVRRELKVKNRLCGSSKHVICTSQAR